MSRLMNRDVVCWNRVAIPRDGDAFDLGAGPSFLVEGFGLGCHCSGGLACRENDQAPFRRGWQMFAQACSRLHGPNGRLEQVQQKSSWVFMKGHSEGCSFLATEVCAIEVKAWCRIPGLVRL